VRQRAPKDGPGLGPRTVSTRDLAASIGVSESSVKRWANDGTLSVLRTPGGHRRIPLEEALRFVRDRRIAVVSPTVLGLPTATGAGGGGDADRLTEALSDGVATDVCGLLLDRYCRGQTIAALVDGPMRVAMERVGQRWRHDPDGILVEHRATELCVQSLNRMRGLLPATSGDLRAVGGAPSGDPYVLPTLAVATALQSEGLRATNLGAETPLGVLTRALEHERPQIAWVSVSTDAGREHLITGLPALLRVARTTGTHVILGGRALQGATVDAPPGTLIAVTISEAAAFARGLKAQT
jgi:excisionase family DNA binding protein